MFLHTISSLLLKVAKLGVGQSYTISNYDGTGRGVTITVNSISGSDSADVSVQCGPDLCSADSECDDFNSVSSIFIPCQHGPA